MRFYNIFSTIRVQGGYQNLIGIDSAYALSVLTGGTILRLNPNYLSDREPILHYLNESKVTLFIYFLYFEKDFNFLFNFKAKNFMIAIAGCELIKVTF